jgi:hypothetical protein
VAQAAGHHSSYNREETVALGMRCIQPLQLALAHNGVQDEEGGAVVRLRATIKQLRYVHD